MELIMLDDRLRYHPPLSLSSVKTLEDGLAWFAALLFIIAAGCALLKKRNSFLQRCEAVVRVTLATCFR